jgi:DNA modification methylase
MENTLQVLIGDSKETLKTVPDCSVNCVVTSPPYYALRSYLASDSPLKPLEIGQEQTPEQYIDNLVAVMEECRRVLKDDGICFINIQDSYNVRNKTEAEQSFENCKYNKQTTTLKHYQYMGAKLKDLIGIPWMLAFKMRDKGWYWRDTIIWAKAVSGFHIFGNCMPESVKDRTNKSHEYILMFTKSAKYSYDWQAIGEAVADISNKRAFYGKHPKNRKNNGNYDYSLGVESQVKFYEKRAKEIEENPDKTILRTRRSVWNYQASYTKVSHFAVYPPKLAETCILAGCPVGGTVLDPFGGSGTTGIVANLTGRNAIICDLNPNMKEHLELRKEEVAKNMGKCYSDNDNGKHYRKLW